MTPEKKPERRICPWCNDAFFVQGRGSNLKRFCSNAGEDSCKRQYEKGARAYVDQALEAGTLAMADLRHALSLHAGRKP